MWEWINVEVLWRIGCRAPQAMVPNPQPRILHAPIPLWGEGKGGAGLLLANRIHHKVFLLTALQPTTEPFNPCALGSDSGKSNAVPFPKLYCSWQVSDYYGH